MKKTLLALAVAAVAASGANATVIYQKDGTKIDLDGRVHLQISNSKGERTDLIDKASRVRVRAFQEIGGGFEAVGAVEFRFTDYAPSSTDKSLGGNTHAKRIFAGFQHKDIGSLTFGKQLVLGDHIPKANYSYELGGNVFLDAHGKAAHFMSAKFAGVRLAADYYFGTANKENTLGAKTADAGQGFQLGAFYDGKIGDVAVRFGSGYGELTKGTTEANEYKTKYAGVGFDVTYGIVSWGVDWAYAKSTKGHKDAGQFQSYSNPLTSPKFEKINRFEVGTKVAVTKQNNIYGSLLFGTAKNQGEEKAKNFGWKLGVDHQFNKFVAVYVEGGKGKTKQNGVTIDEGRKVALGTRILF
ncbi:MAG: porin [Lonepinella koalarum]|nr:porin [Lonepinella koalarum]